MKHNRIVFRILALLVTAASLLGLLGGVRLVPDAHAEEISPYHWFYDQLRENTMEREFYDVLLKMLSDGILAKDEDYEIPLDSHPAISQALVGFTGNMAQLTNAMAKARDGFECDNPDVFWVDFSMLTVRVTKDSNNAFHVFLGTGRGNSYFIRGITKDNLASKKEAYEKAMSTALAWIKDQEPSYDGEPEDKTLATAAHDYLTKNMVYHFEYEVLNADCNSRTAFDALVYQEGVCEAYTRAYKALLDRLGVESVSITGTYYVSPNEFEPHAWSNVKIGDNWYGVDVTHDDPRVKDGWDIDLTHIVYTNNRNSGKENHTYLLVGAWDLSATHKPFGVMSPTNYEEYQYPVMDTYASRNSEEFNSSGLRVVVVEDQDEKGMALFSYNGLTYWDNVNSAGYYFVYRGFDQWFEDSQVKISEWSYMTPEFYGDNIVDVHGPEDEYYNPQFYELMGGPYTQMPLTGQKGFQLGIVNMKPDTSKEAILNGSLYLNYYGFTDESQFIALSEEITNFQFEPYAPPPFPFRVTPTQTATLPLGTETFHVRAEFNQKLVYAEGKDHVEITFTAEQYRYADIDHTARENTSIDHVTFDGNNVIEFDFHPSKMFNDNDTIYNLFFKNVIGEESLKEPSPIGYVVSMDECAYCYKSQGYDWNVFAYPRLLESEEAMLGNDLVVKDPDSGAVDDLDPELLEKISHRLTLVTTEVKDGTAQNEAMLDALEGDDELMGEIGGAENLIETITYNIKLSLCKRMVIQTGQGVRISMGFPEGTTYEDFVNNGNFEFKVYHYIVDPVTGELTGEVEEIPVTVVPQGLIILVKSFSPFTIAKVKLDPATSAQQAADRPVTTIVTSTEGGVLTDITGQAMTGANSVLEMTEGDQRTVVITADEGYVISSINVGGKVYTVDAANSEVYNFVLTSEMLEDLKKDGTFFVEFITKETAEQDEDNGQSAILDEENHEELSAKPAEEVGAKPHTHVIDGENSHFVWSSDGSSCTFKLICRECRDNYGSVAATVSNEKIVQEATCTQPGIKTCDATAEVDGVVYTDSEEIILPLKPHSYDSEGKCTVCGHSNKEHEHTYGEPEFAWTEDQCTAKLKCTGPACPDANKGEIDLEVEVSAHVKSATCSEEGEISYTATVNYNGTTYQSTSEYVKKIDIDPNAHMFENGKCIYCGTVDPSYSPVDPDPSGPTDPSGPSDPSSVPTLPPLPDIPGPTATGAPATTPASSPEDSPKTGDETNFVVLFVLLGASAVGVGISAFLLMKKPKAHKRSK